VDAFKRDAKSSVTSKEDKIKSDLLRKYELFYANRVLSSRHTRARAFPEGTRPSQVKIGDLQHEIREIKTELQQNDMRRTCHHLFMALTNVTEMALVQASLPAEGFAMDAGQNYEADLEADVLEIAVEMGFKGFGPKMRLLQKMVFIAKTRIETNSSRVPEGGTEREAPEQFKL